MPLFLTQFYTRNLGDLISIIHDYVTTINIIKNVLITHQREVVHHLPFCFVNYLERQSEDDNTNK